MSATEAIEVIVPVEEVDLVSGLLWATGITALGEGELDGDLVVLTTDVPPGGLAVIDAALGGRWAAALVPVADDGLDGWRPYAEVSRAGAHLVIQPPWLPFDAEPDDVVLLIDPGRSFGHGAHPTTRLCLAAVEREVRPDSTVLDVGCGSGVLAIAAARLGATAVTAIDIDPEAIAATVANAAANGVAVVASEQPVAAVEGRFDLVLANIGAATLLALAADLVARLGPGGRLVLSGLLLDRADSVVAGFPGLQAVRRDELEGWVTVTLRRDGGD